MPTTQFPDQAGGAQQFGCHRFSRGKTIEHFHVHHGKFAVRRIVKAPLRNPAAQRHLAALKTGTPRIPLARFLSLVAFAGRPAELRADAAAHAHLAVPRSARRLQIGKIHSHVVLNLPELFRYLHDHQMPDLQDHSANRRVIGALHHLVHAAKPQPADRLPHVPGQAMKLRTHLIFKTPDVFLAIAMIVPGALSARVPPRSLSEVPRPWQRPSGATARRTWP